MTPKGQRLANHRGHGQSAMMKRPAERTDRVTVIATAFVLSHTFVFWTEKKQQQQQQLLSQSSLSLSLSLSQHELHSLASFGRGN